MTEKLFDPKTLEEMVQEIVEYDIKLNKSLFDIEDDIKYRVHKTIQELMYKKYIGVSFSSGLGRDSKIKLYGKVPEVKWVGQSGLCGTTYVFLDRKEWEGKSEKEIIRYLNNLVNPSGDPLDKMIDDKSEFKFL